MEYGLILAAVILAWLAGRLVAGRDRRRVHRCLEAMAEAGRPLETDERTGFARLRGRERERDVILTALPAGLAPVLAGERVYGNRAAAIVAEAPLPGDLPAELKVVPRGKGSSLDARAGLQPLETGDAAFDGRFEVLSDQPDRARSWLDQHLRDTLKTVRGRTVWIEVTRVRPLDGGRSAPATPAVRCYLRGIPADCDAYPGVMDVAARLAASIVGS